jgi:nicotinamide mononucleotide transporter
MNEPLILAGLTTSPLELISFLLAVTTVVLNIRQKHWAWLFSIASSATYAVVFYDARLYGDMGLQFVFIAASVWGWYQWLHGAAGASAAPLAPTFLKPGARAWSLSAWLAGFVLLSTFLDNFTDTDVPHADGFLTSGSLVGQLLLAKKKVENWHVWIAVDILYVGLYLYKGLVLTAVLYGVFVLLAIAGLRTWSALARKAS